MSIFGQKVDLITQLKVSTSLGDGLLTDKTHVDNLRNGGGLLSLNVKNKDVIEYIIDLMTIIFGPDFLEKSVKKVMKKVFKRGEDGVMLLEEQLKHSLLDALCGNDGDNPLPDDFLTGDGYAVPVKSLDLFDLFKLNIGNPSDSRLLGGANSFEATFMQKVLQQTQPRPSTFTTLLNISFEFTLLANTVTLKGALPTDNPPATIEDFYRSILFAPGFRLLDANAIAMEVLDVMLGYLSSHRTVRALANESALESLVNKFGNEEETETVFTFNPKSLEDINAKAKLRKKGGYNLDLGCSLENVLVSEEAVLSQIDNQLDFGGMFTSVLEAQLTADGTTLTAPIKQNFQRGLMKALVMVLLKHTLLSPRIWTLFVLSKIFQVGYPKSKYGELVSSGLNQAADIPELLKHRQDIVKTLVAKVRNVLIEYLSSFLIKEVMVSVIKLKESQMKEHLDSYTKIMASFFKVEAVLAKASTVVTQIKTVVS